MSPEAWIALAGLALGLVIALGTFAVWIAAKFETVHAAITTSRHKTMSDLQPKFARFDEDLEKVEGRVIELDKRVTRLEAKAGGD